MSSGEAKRWTLCSSYSVDNDAMKWFVSLDSEITPEVEKPEKIKVMPVADHERVVAELRDKITHAAKANHQAWNELRAKDMKIDQLRAEVERLQDMVDDWRIHEQR